VTLRGGAVYAEVFISLDDLMTHKQFNERVIEPMLGRVDSLLKARVTDADRYVLLRFTAMPITDSEFESLAQFDAAKR